MVRYCDQCGSELKEHAIFCSNCGSKSDLPPEKSVETQSSNNEESTLEKVNDNINETVNENAATVGEKIDNIISKTSKKIGGEQSNKDKNTKTNFDISKLNLKIIIPIIAIILIAVVGFTMLGGGRTVVLEGVEFFIPDGFKETNSIADYGVSIPNAYAKCYVNGAGDFVAVSVSKDSGHSQQDITKAINSGKFTAKTIKGYNGAFQITSGGYGCAFFYIKGDKIAMVYASDESLLNQLIK